MHQLDIEDLSILLIEPSTTQAKIIQDQLRGQGVEKIDLAATGQDGLTLLDHYMPDLVISSMYLRVLPGREIWIGCVLLVAGSFLSRRSLDGDPAQ